MNANATTDRRQARAPRGSAGPRPPRLSRPHDRARVHGPGVHPLRDPRSGGGVRAAGGVRLRRRPPGSSRTRSSPPSCGPRARPAGGRVASTRTETARGWCPPGARPAWASASGSSSAPDGPPHGERSESEGPVHQLTERRPGDPEALLACERPRPAREAPRRRPPRQVASASDGQGRGRSVLHADGLHYSPIQTGLAYLPLTGTVIVGAGVGLTPVRPARHQAVHRRRWRDPCGRALPALAHPDRRHARLGPAARDAGGGTRDRRPVRRRHHGRQPRRREGQGRPRSRSAQHRPAAGVSLGLAVLSALATDRTRSLLHAGQDTVAAAATNGYERALTVGVGFFSPRAVIAFLTRNARPTAPAEPPSPYRTSPDSIAKGERT